MIVIWGPQHTRQRYQSYRVRQSIVFLVVSRAPKQGGILDAQTPNGKAFALRILGIENSLYMEPLSLVGLDHMAVANTPRNLIM